MNKIILTKKIKYNFYYDESFHDRAISVNENGLNIHDANACDFFVYVFSGVKKSKLNQIENSYASIEADIKNKLKFEPDKEFKAVTIPKSNFKHGLRSINKVFFSFYNQLFDFIMKEDVIFQFGFQNKTEYLMQQFLTCLARPDFLVIDTTAFLYSMTKFVYHYRWKSVFLSFFDFDKGFDAVAIKTNLLKLFERVHKNIKGIPRCVAEEKALEQMMIILSYCKVRNKVELNKQWQYESVFCGFNKLLSELKISSEFCNIFIDQEEKTYNTALAFDYGKVEECQSHECIMVRLSDILSNFFGRLIVSLQDALRDPDFSELSQIKRENYVEKRLLPKEWFLLDNRHFNLYRKFHKFLEKISNIYWSSFVTIYSDKVAMMFALFNYFSSYNSFEEYKKIEADLHRERFNSCSINYLSQKSSINFQNFEWKDC